MTTLTALDPSLYQDLVGVPYCHNGRDPRVGLDCFGLVLAIHARMGTPLPDPYTVVPTTYGSDGDPGDHQWLLQQLFGEWRPADPAPGLVAVFSRFGKRPDHAGVFITERRFIHAIHYRYQTTGQVVISDRARSPFDEWFIGAYAYAGH